MRAAVLAVLALLAFSRHALAEERRRIEILTRRKI